MKRVLSKILKPEAFTIENIVKALHEHNLKKIFDIVNSDINIQLADCKSKINIIKAFRDLVDHTIKV